MAVFYPWVGTYSYQSVHSGLQALDGAYDRPVIHATQDLATADRLMTGRSVARLKSIAKGELVSTEHGSTFSRRT